MALDTTLTLGASYTLELTLLGSESVQLVPELQSVLLESQITLGIPGRDGKDGTIEHPELLVSEEAGNSLIVGGDNKLYVPDDIETDPLAYYILAKG